MLAEVLGLAFVHQEPTTHKPTLLQGMQASTSVASNAHKHQTRYHQGGQKIVASPC